MPLSVGPWFCRRMAQDEYLYREVFPGAIPRTRMGSDACNVRGAKVNNICKVWFWWNSRAGSFPQSRGCLEGSRIPSCGIRALSVFDGRSQTPQETRRMATAQLLRICNKQYSLHYSKFSEAWQEHQCASIILTDRDFVHGWGRGGDF